MTHQGDQRVFQAAMRRAEREMPQGRPTEQSSARAELTGTALRPCRLEGKLYE